MTTEPISSSSTGVMATSHGEGVKHRSHSVDAVIDFIAGTNGGIANVYVGQSLDTVKVKMQTFPNLYRNAFDCFIKTYKQDGIYRGLYAGTVPALIANVAENSILFLFYGVCQKGVMYLSRHKSVKDLRPIHNAFAGSGAAFFAAFTLSPTELVKCRLQAMREMATQGKLEGGLDRLKIARSSVCLYMKIPEKPVRNDCVTTAVHLDDMAAGVAVIVIDGPFGLTKEILQQEGVRGLYKGLTSTMAREMPGYFFFFGGYELSRHLLTPAGKTKDDIGVWRTMLSGGIGGMALWTSIFPTDVVKSRIQVQSTIGTKAPTFTSTLIHIGKTEGVRALYKGLGPTLVRTFPSTGALFLTVETTKKVLSDVSDKFM